MSAKIQSNRSTRLVNRYDERVESRWKANVGRNHGIRLIRDKNSCIKKENLD